MMGTTVAWALIGAALLSAAVTCRQHDRNIGVALALTASMSANPDPVAFALTFGSALGYFAALGALVVQLARPGSALPNRFGVPRAGDDQ